MIITTISDTHNQHRWIPKIFFPGGDLLVCTGDITTDGYQMNQIIDFCDWFNSLNQYKHKIFIAGNHDRLFEKYPNTVSEIYTRYQNITYLEDSIKFINNINIYGSPWQPEFCNWAFNLPRNGNRLKDKWEMIPEDTDILLTHGPPYSVLDTSGPPYNKSGLGCELLAARVAVVKPKIHIFGHIHGSFGYKFMDDTHFINTSVLNEKYEYRNHPLTFEWDPENNLINFV